jgi:hypothetical protein
MPLVGDRQLTLFGPETKLDLIYLPLGPDVAFFASSSARMTQWVNSLGSSHFVKQMNKGMVHASSMYVWVAISSAGDWWNGACSAQRPVAASVLDSAHTVGRRQGFAKRGDSKTVEDAHPLRNWLSYIESGHYMVGKSGGDSGACCRSRPKKIRANHEVCIRR